MSTKAACTLLGILGLLLLFSATGCSTVAGPNYGMLNFPVPVSPYFQKMAEDRYWVHRRYERMPILGPLTPGSPEIAIDDPPDDEIMRKLEEARPVQGGLPLLHEIQRSKVRIRKYKIADYIDPVREYPLCGPAQLHHAHWKCVVDFTETTWVGWPIPYKTTDEDAQEVIYIDHDHLHMVGNLDFGAGSNY